MSVKVEEKESIAQMSEGTISNEVLTEWNKRIGASLRVGNTFNQFVSLEAIRKYVNGIGDIPFTGMWTMQERAPMEHSLRLQLALQCVSHGCFKGFRHSSLSLRQ
jgi:hypothetical protein